MNNTPVLEAMVSENASQKFKDLEYGNLTKGVDYLFNLEGELQVDHLQELNKFTTKDFTDPRLHDFPDQIKIPNFKLYKDYEPGWVRTVDMSKDGVNFKMTERYNEETNSVEKVNLKNDLQSELSKFYQVANNPDSSKLDVFKAALNYHVNFEKIHPFVESNGRIGRLTMEKMLDDQNLAAPSFKLTSESKQKYESLMKDAVSSKPNNLEMPLDEKLLEFAIKQTEQTATAREKYLNEKGGAYSQEELAIERKKIENSQALVKEYQMVKEKQAAAEKHAADVKNMYGLDDNKKASIFSWSKLKRQIGLTKKDAYQVNDAKKATKTNKTKPKVTLKKYEKINER